MDYKQFYIELGRLLYAIAKSDGAVQKEEIDEFYTIVKQELLTIEHSQDELGTDRTFYSEFEFETLMDKEANMKKAFQSFLKFLQKNKGSITEEIKQVCMNSVIKVAEAYQGIESSEQVFIDKLQEELDKL